MIKRFIIQLCLVLFSATACYANGDYFNPLKLDFPYLDTNLVNKYWSLFEENIDYSTLFFKQEGILSFSSTWKGKDITEKTIFIHDSIRSLNISGFKKRIPENILGFKNIEYLSIENIDTIDFDLLSNLKNLRFLAITGFEYIEGNLSNNKRIISLSLNSKNNLSFNLTDNFYRTNSLQILSLIGNFNIDGRVNQLEQLNEIHLSSLSSIHNLKLPKLKYLSIESNNSTSAINFSNTLFKDNYIEFLSILGINNNPCEVEITKFPRLKYLRIINCKLKDSLFSNKYYKLKILSLQNNSLTQIPTFVSNFQNIEILDLSLNYIKYIDTSINALKKLKKINFYGNIIDSLSENINLKSLEEFYLASNLLKTFPMIKIPKIRIIYLWENQFTTIPEWFNNLKDCEINMERNYIRQKPESSNIITSDY